MCIRDSRSDLGIVGDVLIHIGHEVLVGVRLDTVEHVAHRHRHVLGEDVPAVDVHHHVTGLLALLPDFRRVGPAGRGDRREAILNLGDRQVTAEPHPDTLTRFGRTSREDQRHDRRADALALDERVAGDPQPVTGDHAPAPPDQEPPDGSEDPRQPDHDGQSHQAPDRSQPCRHSGVQAQQQTGEDDLPGPVPQNPQDRPGQRDACAEQSSGESGDDRRHQSRPEIEEREGDQEGHRAGGETGEDADDFGATRRRILVELVNQRLRSSRTAPATTSRFATIRTHGRTTFPPRGAKVSVN